jgi:hypothetical protein
MSRKAAKPKRLSLKGIPALFLEIEDMSQIMPATFRRVKNDSK